MSRSYSKEQRRAYGRIVNTGSRPSVNARRRMRINHAMCGERAPGTRDASSQDMTAASFASKAHKALKAAVLAISAEMLGNEHECQAAARRAGAIAASLGITLESMWADLGCEGILDATLTWGSIVDGFYDARDAREQAFAAA